MAHVILVHGLGATDKSWFDIPCRIEAAGHTVDPVQLPLDVTRGLQDYAEDIAGAFPDSGELVLVGHSTGGMAISQAAADHSTRVSKLIYVTALVPKDGETALGVIADLGTTLEEVSQEFDRIGIALNSAVRQLPMTAALTGKFRVSDGFEAVPKHYIGCMNDAVVKPMAQLTMTDKWAFETTAQIPSGHIPQKEKPAELETALLDIIG